jgi:hypothetical protein
LLMKIRLLGQYRNVTADSIPCVEVWWKVRGW